MIDWSGINIKLPSNFADPPVGEIYAEYIVKDNFIQFLDLYESLIDEKDFELILEYHYNKEKAGLTRRVNNLYSTSSKKKYSLEHLCNEILLFKIDEKDFENNIKYHLYTFFIYFDKVYVEIKEHLSKINVELIFQDKFIEFRTKFLKQMLLDVHELLPSLEKKNDIDPESEIGRNRNIDGYEIFGFVSCLSNGIVDYSNKTYFTTLAYLIRQSIEIRMKNALGIVAIFNEGSQVRVTSDIFINFLFKNKKITLPDGISKSVLEKIFTWSNINIHMGRNLYMWQFMAIQDYIEPLFGFGETERSFHISGAISIDKKYYEDDLVEDMKDFLKSKSIEVTNIILKNKPEALLI